MTQQGNGPHPVGGRHPPAFGEFFTARGHLAPPPASLVPAGDPSVLFIIGRHQQFKPDYLGVDTPPARRPPTTCQRCFRTSDIENVGRTARHLTFFEMLGNFSTGIYFKREAIAWALEFSYAARHRPDAREGQRLRRRRAGAGRRRGDRHLEVPRLHRGRHRAPRARRQLLGARPAPTGPCGPCSELYYDMGAQFGCGRPHCGPGCECDPSPNQTGTWSSCSTR